MPDPVKLTNDEMTILSHKIYTNMCKHPEKAFSYLMLLSELNTLPDMQPVIGNVLYQWFDIENVQATAKKLNPKLKISEKRDILMEENQIFVQRMSLFGEGLFENSLQPCMNLIAENKDTYSKKFIKEQLWMRDFHSAFHVLKVGMMNHLHNITGFTAMLFSADYIVSEALSQHKAGNAVLYNDGLVIAESQEGANSAEEEAAYTKRLVEINNIFCKRANEYIHMHHNATISVKNMQEAIKVITRDECRKLQEAAEKEYFEQNPDIKKKLDDIELKKQNEKKDPLYISPKTAKYHFLNAANHRTLIKKLYSELDFDNLTAKEKAAFENGLADVEKAHVEAIPLDNYPTEELNALSTTLHSMAKESWYNSWYDSKIFRTVIKTMDRIGGTEHTSEQSLKDCINACEEYLKTRSGVRSSDHGKARQKQIEKLLHTTKKLEYMLYRKNTTFDRNELLESLRNGVIEKIKRGNLKIDTNALNPNAWDKLIEFTLINMGIWENCIDSYRTGLLNQGNQKAVVENIFPNVIKSFDTILKVRKEDSSLESFNRAAIEDIEKTIQETFNKKAKNYAEQMKNPEKKENTKKRTGQKKNEPQVRQLQ